MTCHTKEQLEQMLFDVVNELDLSDGMLEKHGPHGTPPAILVREVLEQKDLQISLLRKGFAEAHPEKTKAQLLFESAPALLAMVERCASELECHTTNDLGERMPAADLLADIRALLKSARGNQS